MATELTNTQTDRTALKVEGQVFEITKAVTFEAAHFMGGKPEGHPYRNMHGHSFRLEATVAGTVQPGAEWVQDFSDLSAILAETAAKLDHRLLNEIDGLSVPTLERIALWAANDLKPKLPGLKRVALARPSLDEACVLVLQ
ncbi:MAG: 6-pyruvoyl tetrahydropterin synthase family protein [Hyphomonas sp.]|jgi:6-pyruvoyltetrahydropterin/6-carboxytetrahydropterin synthase|nr:6-pyruvoyl tetrahydropterin synthase family protein [Alphaproteobacteria bacterium]MCR9224943.1 6-pyruvoyl tetrahydropterin synthase family protein [Hyphomonas sp.]